MVRVEEVAVSRGVNVQNIHCMDSSLEHKKRWNVNICPGIYEITNIKYRLIELLYSKCLLLKLISYIVIVYQLGKIAH